jgi:hypothetical protein
MNFFGVLGIGCARHRWPVWHWVCLLGHFLGGVAHAMCGVYLPFFP